MVAAKKKFWSKTKTIMIAVAGTLGVTGASVRGLILNASDNTAKSYIKGVVHQEYIILNQNDEKRLQILEKRDSCATSDIRYTRYLLEEVVSGQNRAAAKEKMQADSEWQVK